jgi:hypothetical protein
MDHRTGKKKCQKNLTKHGFFGPWANGLCAHILFSFLIEKKFVKKSTNHKFCGAWVNKLCVHIQNN